MACHGGAMAAVEISVKPNLTFNIQISISKVTTAMPWQAIGQSRHGHGFGGGGLYRDHHSGHGAAMATMEIFEFENGFCEVISEQLLADVSLQLAVLFVEKIEGSLTQFVVVSGGRWK